MTALLRPRAALRHLMLLLVCALVAGSLHAAPLKVVASFSILADLAREVGGERVEVQALIGPNTDAHGWNPRPSDARRVMQAQLVLANGLGFDAWIERLVAATGGPAVLTVSAGITSIERATPQPHGHHHHHGPQDPHAWQDVSNARQYARNIAAELIHLDPEGEAHYRARQQDFDARLEALDQEIRQSLAALPAELRSVVSSHDAFGYFSRAYGLRFQPAVGSGSHSEVSAATMARLIEQLRREQAPVVFIENIADPRLLERISQESGARIGGRLYSDALSAADGPAASYIQMMRHNLTTLLAGLNPAET